MENPQLNCRERCRPAGRGGGGAGGGQRCLAHFACRCLNFICKAAQKAALKWGAWHCATLPGLVFVCFSGRGGAVPGQGGRSTWLFSIKRGKAKWPETETTNCFFGN